MIEMIENENQGKMILRKQGFACPGLPGWRLKAAWGMMACAESLSVLSSWLGFIFKWDHNMYKIVQDCTSMYKYKSVWLSFLGPNNKLIDVDCRGPNPSPTSYQHHHPKAIAEATLMALCMAKALWQNQRENIAFLLQTSRYTVFTIFTTGLLIGCLHATRWR